MSSLFMKTSQKIQESFFGPRTKDQDFDQIKNSVEEFEKTINSTRNILQNFGKFAKNMKDFCKEVKDMTSLIYDKDSQFHEIGAEICESHNFIEKTFNEFITEVNDIYNSTSEWNGICNPTKTLIEKREESRKLYDYYQKKMSELNKTKEVQIFKSGKINEKLIERILRNEEKYQIASENFINHSYEAYYGLRSILEKKNEIFNSMMIKFIQGEVKFFQNIGNTFKNLENVETMINQESRNSLKNVSDYNPKRYTVKSYFSDNSDTTTGSSIGINNNGFDLMSLSEFDSIKNEYSFKNIQEKDLSRKTIVMKNNKSDKVLSNSINFIPDSQKNEIQNTKFSHIKIEEKLKIFEKKNDLKNKVKYFEKNSDVSSNTVDDIKPSETRILKSNILVENNWISNQAINSKEILGNLIKSKNQIILNEKGMSTPSNNNGSNNKFEKTP